MSILSNIGMVPVVGNKGNRVPFVFTSLKRLYDAGLQGSLGQKLAELSDPYSLVDMAVDAYNSASTAVTSSIDAISEIASDAPGAADSMWTAIRAKAEEIYSGKAAGPASSMTYIEMLVNPVSMTWTNPKRIVPVKTRSGTTFFHFTDTAGRNDDILALSFAGVTGNIDLRSATVAGGGDVQAAAKLRMWYELHALSREPMIFTTPDGEPRDNVMFCIFFSKVFPNGVIMGGHFNEVLSFEETAYQPNMLQYRFGFTARFTSPSLHSMHRRLAADLKMLEEGGVDILLSSVVQSIVG